MRSAKQSLLISSILALSIFGCATKQIVNVIQVTTNTFILLPELQIIVNNTLITSIRIPVHPTYFGQSRTFVET